MMTYAYSTPTHFAPVVCRMTLPDDAPRDKDGLLDSRVVGRFIREKILEKGWTFTDFANRVDLTPTYLSAMLAGRNNLARSNHFKVIAAELGLSRDEVEYINPNIIWVHPDAERFAPMVAPAPERPLPPALLSAMEIVNKMGQNLTEKDVRALLPKGLDGKGPQTEAEWVEFLLFVKKWL